MSDDAGFVNCDLSTSIEHLALENLEGFGECLPPESTGIERRPSRPDEMSKPKKMPNIAIPPLDNVDADGKPKLVSWASEMSMYDGQSPRTPSLPLMKTPTGYVKTSTPVVKDSTTELHHNNTLQVPGPGPPGIPLDNVGGTWARPSEETSNGHGYNEHSNGQGYNDHHDEIHQPMAPHNNSPPPRVQMPGGGDRDRELTPDDEFTQEPSFDDCNLIINYLPPDTGSQDLRALFNDYGNIVNCKVVVDHTTGLSKGFGFVKYERPEMATEAIKALNRFQLQGKTLKVSLARKNVKKGGETGHTNLYIANLDRNIDSDDLQRHFSKCGHIVQCRVLRDEQGETRRIGFVRYGTHAASINAIKLFDNKSLEGCKNIIQVRFANTPRKEAFLPKGFGGNSTAPIFDQHGNPVENNGGMINPMAPGPLSPQHAAISPTQAAISPSLNAMSPQQMMGYTYPPMVGFPYQPPPGTYVQQQPQFSTDGSYGQQAVYSSAGTSPHQPSYAQQQPFSNPNSSNPNSKTCYVAGFDIDLQEKDLQDAFENIGAIKNVRIVRRRSGPYAFVNFHQSSDAFRAAEGMNNTKIGNYEVTVRVKHN